ncbi:hypothetical protein NDU88_001948 [Pleurodeles waltl]|uniref:Uncharacterized protein n=1 Tax=Pleurodeles waltl TaxID=8319 RepID=A0AAV7LCH8_PLEWA|nr:hypothetical protein NDU88_001948 [Pleurodeles waltl]
MNVVCATALSRGLQTPLAIAVVTSYRPGLYKVCSFQTQRPHRSPVVGGMTLGGDVVRWSGKRMNSK